MTEENRNFRKKMAERKILFTLIDTKREEENEKKKKKKNKNKNKKKKKGNGGKKERKEKKRYIFFDSERKIKLP